MFLVPDQVSLDNWKIAVLSSLISYVVSPPLLSNTYLYMFSEFFGALSPDDGTVPSSKASKITRERPACAQKHVHKIV